MRPAAQPASGARGEGVGGLADGGDRPGGGVLAAGEPSAEARGVRPHPGLRWWREVAYILAFYGVYSLVRNTQGSAAVSAQEALANAVRVIRLERLLGLYHEETLQDLFLERRWFIEAWNLFYGSLHFVVTAAALVVLFRRFPERYRPWRNALAATTALALVGFALFPLMPPRLLPSAYGYVDTLEAYGSLWSFDSASVQSISNQYAAMPSLHVAWALWSCLVLYGVVRSPWARALAVLYPLATVFAIVVTANHYVLDALGGVAVLGIGSVLAFLLPARLHRTAAAPGVA